MNKKNQLIAFDIHQPPSWVASSKRRSLKGTNNTFLNKSPIQVKILNAIITYVYLCYKSKKRKHASQFFWKI